MSVLLLALTLFVSPARAGQEIGPEIQAQFQRLHSFVSALEPEFTVGGYLKGKSYGDHELLWHLATEPGEAEVIRVYREKGPSEQAFDITFHRNRAIVPGRIVIRRFVGPESTGWRNDTVDEETGDYLGMQGEVNPAVDARDQAILRKWLGAR